MKLQLPFIKFQQKVPTLIDWRDDYLNSKQVRLEKTTLSNYKRVITLYIREVGETHWPPTRFDVIRYLDEVKGRSSQMTAFSYWSVLRGWFNYMDKLGAFGCQPNPAEQIEQLELAPQNPKTMAKGIPNEHIDSLFAYLRLLPSTLTNFRDLALLHFLYRTGARAGEAAQLSFQVLQLELNQVYIPAEVVKNDEERQLFFGEKVKADLNKWLSVLTQHEYKGPWVFPSTRGQKPLDHPLTVSGINQMFHRRLKQAGLPIYRVHDLRHTFTKDAMRKGKSLSSIQRQLGHSSPDMVLRYAKVFSQEQRQEFINFGDD